MASRDIKLENTLLDGSPRPLVKICDFGYSKVCQIGALTEDAERPRISSCSRMQHEKFQSAPGSRVGTPAYLAPEVIMTTKGQTYDGKVAQFPVNLSRHWCDQEWLKLTAVKGGGHLELRRHAVRDAGGCVPLRATRRQGGQPEAAKDDPGACLISSYTAMMLGVSIKTCCWNTTFFYI